MRREVIASIGFGSAALGEAFMIFPLLGLPFGMHLVPDAVVSIGLTFAAFVVASIGCANLRPGARAPLLGAAGILLGIDGVWSLYSVFVANPWAYSHGYWLFLTVPFNLALIGLGVVAIVGILLPETVRPWALLVFRLVVGGLALLMTLGIMLSLTSVTVFLVPQLLIGAGLWTAAIGLPNRPETVSISSVGPPPAPAFQRWV